jgi:DNA-binding NarL/FixJ family response regulator
VKILIVEDSETDRALLLYILQERFSKDSKFREASTLGAAIKYLERGDINCIILDLALPDSSGKETFTTLYDRFGHIPIIVMTHNQDRALALNMIKAGAADYILKDFTNEEDIFRRITYAIEKNKICIRIDTDSVKQIKNLDKSKSQMMTAHNSGQHSIAQNLTVETTSALADISKNIFLELQKNSLDGIKNKAEFDIKHQNVIEDIKEIKNIINGRDGVSLPAQLQLVTHRVVELEKNKDKIETRMDSKIDIETSIVRKKTEQDEINEFKLKSHSLDARTKIIIALFGLIATITGGYFTYKSATNSSTTQTPSGIHP